MKKYYPVYLDLCRAKVLVVGGGGVAERKIRNLLQAGASLIVVAPSATSIIRKLAGQKKLRWHSRGFRERDLSGCSLVISATDQPLLNEWVSNSARRRGIFCNVVDQKHLCSFLAPAMLRRGCIQIAVSTGGASPALAVEIRDRMKQWLDPSYKKMAILLERFRKQLMTQGLRPAERSRRNRAMVKSAALRLLQEGKVRQGEQLLRSLSRGCNHEVTKARKEEEPYET